MTLPYILYSSLVSCAPSLSFPSISHCNLVAITLVMSSTPSSTPPLRRRQSTLALEAGIELEDRHSLGSDPRYYHFASSDYIPTDSQRLISSTSGSATNTTTPYLDSSPKQGVKINMWRILNTVFMLAVGVTKAVFTYQGYSTAPTTLDWVIGVVWAMV